MSDTPDEVHAIGPLRARGARAGDTRHTVLLVEDDDDSREMMKEYLESIGYLVEEAATGPDAVRRALAVRPTVVLLDMTLPGGLGGLEVASLLRADPITRDVLLVALSGRELVGEARASFAGVLTKPADLERLEGMLRQLLEGRSERPPAR